MSARLVIDARALAQVKRDAHAPMLQVGQDIGHEAQGNIERMGLVRTGRLYRSLTVKQDPETGDVRVGFTAPYAEYTHEGTDEEDPHPFLALAAFKRRTIS